MPTQPDPRLVPLLKKHGISWELFSKRGRPAKGIRAKRETIVTELHVAGTPWANMMKITGLSLAGVHRLTKATWNPASRRNRQESAARVGRAGKGRQLLPETELNQPSVCDRLFGRYPIGLR